ncbi:MAG: nucleotidyl transferase AbiEii/AbiGii toxin family protein [Acetobacteraceae bacterium]
MASTFAPRLDVLPPPQRRLWDELAAVPGEFALYGGTAIALHLGHRQSADFDFFGTRAFAPAALTGSISFLAPATITRQAPSTLSVRLDRDGTVRVAFFGLPALPRLAPPLIAPGNGVHVAALIDLAGTKAAVVQQRAEARDYSDIDAIIRDGGIDLPAALAAARALYGRSFNPQITLKALSYFEDGNLPTLEPEVKGRLAAAARTVDLDDLPPIPPLPR